MPRCCVKEFDYDTGKDKRCKRPIGMRERDKGFKTCASHGREIERKNMHKRYVEMYSYQIPNTKPYLKEIYGENQYGESMFFDTEWFHHDDCGKVKVIPMNGGIAMVSENGETVITSLGEIRRMLNILFDAGAIRELGMPFPEPIDEVLITMGRRELENFNEKRE